MTVRSGSCPVLVAVYVVMSSQGQTQRSSESELRVLTIVKLRPVRSARVDIVAPEASTTAPFFAQAL